MESALKYYRANRERIDNFHKQRNLTFIALESPSDVYRYNKTLIHKSYRPTYRNMSSRYYIAMINGRPAYVRVSDHWGTFFTWSEDEECYISHHWELDGGKRKKNGEYPNTSQAGYIFLD